VTGEWLATLDRNMSTSVLNDIVYSYRVVQKVSYGLGKLIVMLNC